ncbi:MAG: hypothetical protein IAF94_06650, partial [Pirellulaceae bacterium]|nr:hypothetical protein [Pirellulaceae bacterium]
MATSLLIQLITGKARLFAGIALAAAAGLTAPGTLSAQHRQQRPARPSVREFRFEEQLEVAQAEPEPEIAAQAESTEMQAYPVPPDRLQEVAMELQKKYIGRKDVRITPNKRVNQIFVNAPIEVLHEIAAFLAPEVPAEKGIPAPKPVDQRTMPPAAQRVRGTHPLKNVSAHDFELALARIWYKRASFTASHDRRTTQVKVPFGEEGLVAITIDHERDLVSIDMPGNAQDSWRQVLRAIDAPQRPGGTQSELVALNRAEPDKVKKALELIRAVTRPFASVDGPKRHIGQFVSTIFQQEQPAGGAQPAEAQPPA